jgi:hypothetical protein
LQPQQPHEPAQRKLSPEQQPHHRRRPGAAKHLAVEADEDEEEEEDEHPGGLTENNYGSGEAFIAKQPPPQALIAPERAPIIVQSAPPLPAAAVSSGASSYSNGSFPVCACASSIQHFEASTPICAIFAGEASELDALLAASSALAAEAEQLVAEVHMAFFFSHLTPCPRNPYTCKGSSSPRFVIFLLSHHPGVVVQVDTQMAEAYARADEVIRRAHQQLLRTCT